MINVTDQINSAIQPADPSGVRDSSPALQAVADSIVFDQHPPNNPKYVHATSVPTVYFPPGRYRLESPVNWKGVCTIQGESSIVWTDRPIDLFQWANGSIVRVNGMRFVGGLSHLLIHNQNINGTTIGICDCMFEDSALCAVSVVPAAGKSQVSGSLVIGDGTRFRNCGSIVETYTDTTKLNGIVCEWPLSRQTGFAIVNYRGRMEVNGGEFYPMGEMTETKYWVRNAGGFSSTCTRWSGEFGGIPVLYNTSQPRSDYPFMGQPSDPAAGVVSFQNCQLSAGKTANPASAIVTLEKCPSRIVFDNCDNMVEVPLIRALDGALSGIDKRKIPPQVLVRGCQSWPAIKQNDSRIPKELWKWTSIQ